MKFCNYSKCNKKCKNCKKQNTSSDKDKFLNNFITLEELKTKLYLIYGNCIELHSLDEIENKYYMNKKYVFYRTEMIYKHPKEFTCYLRDILYRNVYWIDSEYKRNAIYDNIKNDIKSGKFIKNTEFNIDIHMDDGYDIKFYPDYINMNTKTALQYFDMSWFLTTDINKPREYTSKILDYFKNSNEWTLEYYFEGNFEKDFD